MNTIPCNFDGGDCCPGENCVTLPDVPLDWLDDGFCDQLWNFEAFGFDGKDCCSCNEVEFGVPCVSDVSTIYCNDNCACKRPKSNQGI